VSKTLVTTALESTWPKEGPVMFLGSWCCSFSKRGLWSSLDSETFPYHWDDRDKLMKDYGDLECVYEKFLVVLAKQLNELHSANFSDRFWRILIGPWLYTCVQVVFDRWYMLKIAIDSQELMQLYALGNDASYLVTDDMDAFNDAIESDKWNEALYSFLVETFFAGEVHIDYVKEPGCRKTPKINNKTISFKSRIRGLCNAFSRFVSRDKDVFVLAPHMSFFKQIVLHLKLRQFPVFWFRNIEGYSYQDRSFDRKNTTLSCQIGVLPDFEVVLNNMLFHLIPRVYLEGFDFLFRTAKQQGWPKIPSAIFTSNSYASDEVFKCWVGDKVDSGSSLIIGQHGGNFGMTPMAIHESHQIKIADKWLSWGWKDLNESKILPVGNFKSKFKKIKHNSDGDALLVMMTLPKFSYYLYSVPIAGQMDSYFDDQLQFAEALPDHIRRELRVRLYPLDRDWDQKGRWQAWSDGVLFDSNNQSLIDSLRASRIFIGTYNATTYLETFAVNMPSILFWNPEHWEVTADTASYFERLKSVGVLHTSPKSAAAHLSKIWNNVDGWWFSNEVQDIINGFNNCYSMRNPRLLTSMATVLKSH
jgi:putative transferase (TIGR04331 family)